MSAPAVHVGEGHMSPNIRPLEHLDLNHLFIYVESASHSAYPWLISCQHSPTIYSDSRHSDKLMPPRRRKPPRAGALTELPPLKIVRSILLLQLFYYAAASVLILFTTLVLGQKFSLALVLDWHSVRGDTTVGWTVGFLWVVDGFLV